MGWSIVAYMAYRSFTSKTAPSAHRVSLLVALAVLSHWILDWLVHRPDLPLYDDAHKVGLALWNDLDVRRQDSVRTQIARFSGAVASRQAA